jgi:GNAT superfamily N-acetyltransferase
VVIRDAVAGDAPAVAALLDELGYPTDPKRAQQRIERYAAHPSARLLVAELEDTVVGLAGVAVLPLVEHDESWARLTAIVVGEAYRGRGVGRALVEAVEAEAQARGCNLVELTTADRRVGAHEFYRRLGYEEVSRRFLKAMPGFPPRQH